MGEKLAGGNVAIALLANTTAAGAMLVTLIFTFGPISGAHFNPAVTLAIASQRGIAWGDVPVYILAQVLGALLGVGAAHLMFGEAVFQVSEHARDGGAQLFSEFVATFGLLCVIWAVLACALKPCPLQSASTSQEPTGLQLQRLSPILQSRSHERLRIRFPGSVRSTRLASSWLRFSELLRPQFFSTGLCHRFLPKPIRSCFRIVRLGTNDRPDGRAREMHRSRR